MEGIIRSVRLSSPETDIIMLHFADPDKSAVISHGQRPEVISIHEKVAEHYSITSLDLAQEVAERIHAGEFTWEKDFVDLHPSPFGQELYARSIKKLLIDAWSEQICKNQQLISKNVPEPLDEKCYCTGKLVQPSCAEPDTQWIYHKNWQPADTAAARAGFAGIPVLESAVESAELVFNFSGSAVGLFVLSGPDAGAVEYSVDGGLYAARDLFTQWSANLHLPWTVMLYAGLENTRHVLRLRAAKSEKNKKEKQTLRIAYFLVN